MKLEKPRLTADELKARGWEQMEGEVPEVWFLAGIGLAYRGMAERIEIYAREERGRALEAAADVLRDVLKEHRREMVFDEAEKMWIDISPADPEAGLEEKRYDHFHCEDWGCYSLDVYVQRILELKGKP